MRTKKQLQDAVGTDEELNADVEIIAVLERIEELLTQLLAK